METGHSGMGVAISLEVTEGIRYIYPEADAMLSHKYQGVNFGSLGS